MAKKKKIEEICKNCRLYDPGKKHCSVVVLWEGERVHIPVDPQDKCFFTDKFDSNSGENFQDDIKQVRFWTEDEKGQPTNGNGTVKVEYPEGFFGKTSLRDILG
jgi:hypothetical protein